MRGTLIMALAIALIAVIFALQNAGSIDVHFGPWSFAAPLALILLLSLATGVLIGYLSTLSKTLHLGSEIRKLKKGLESSQSTPEIEQAEATEDATEVPADETAPETDPSAKVEAS